VTRGLCAERVVCREGCVRRGLCDERIVSQHEVCWPRNCALVCGVLCCVVCVLCCLFVFFVL
jgi:hypothetical protein